MSLNQSFISNFSEYYRYQNLPGISLMRVGNIAFLPLGYGFLRNRWHDILTLARRFRATNLSL